MVDEDNPAWVHYGLDQALVEKFVRVKFTDKVFESVEERCLRLVEEAIELTQAALPNRQKEVCGKLEMLIKRVFDRPPGDPEQELGGVIVTLLAYCALKEVRLDSAARHEIDRISGFDREHFELRQKDKQLAGVTADFPE